MYIILIVSIIMCPKFAMLERRVGEPLHVANDISLLPLQMYPKWEQGYIVGDNFLAWREAYISSSSGLSIKISPYSKKCLIFNETLIFT